MKMIGAVHTMTFRYDEDYYVDIVFNEDEEVFEAWLYNKGYSVKYFMLGIPLNHIICDLTSFLQAVEAEIEDYIEYYKEEYEDEDDDSDFII